ncbi:hypothetical protein NBT05_12670 [Aquimarina sp. ERC-38]|uniref:hypothetical protein n=1 Tax=Aquimarina sp. ERC-38 TaxID=2949996 RepID=UPI0022485437|nr:hypothetical protein [Aquimarina sp. ERC-38]UZO79802.1 hypothetical protein NBT05_12670 [Aquimarina sp. ERC-38]
MFKFFTIFVILTGFASTTMNAQFSQPKNPWIMGFGVNLINDSVEGGNGLLDFSDRYHYHMPFSLSIEKKFNTLLGLNLGLNNNRYLEGKIINNRIVDEDIRFFAADLGLRFYPSNLWTNPERTNYELFGTGGISLTFLDGDSSPNFFIGPGVNIYLSDNWWFQGQGLAKITLDNRIDGSNYLQVNIGVIYKFLDDTRCGCY